MGTAIFYASSTGNTQYIAKEISQILGEIPIIDIANEGISSMDNYDNLILGLSTWGEGELQDDWDEVWNELKKIDFSKKTVALFGLGDQEDYSYNYVDALGVAYNELVNKAKKIVGFSVVTSDYYFDESAAVIGEQFVGLALDEDNQEELTELRVKNWCEDIKEEIL